MRVERTAIWILLVCGALGFFAEAATAHGGVVEEDDLCVIKVNYLRAHFKIYQPRVTAHEQFCEDLPQASESVFVMEYQHDALATMPIDFRIIHDVTGKGRFARTDDVAEIEDIDGVTVFYQAATLEPDVYTIAHEFEEEGDFIGIVSARHPDTNKVYTAVFPFEVGFTGLGYWPFFIGILVLLQMQYLFMSGRLKRMFSRGSRAAVTVAAVVFLAIPLDSLADDVVVTYSTPDGPPEINRIHSWILHIATQDGTPVNDADVNVEGGMPEHDHGLPTRPRVTQALGDGDYRLDGMRFHMSGYWEITVTVATGDGESVVVIPLHL